MPAASAGQNLPSQAAPLFRGLSRQEMMEIRMKEVPDRPDFPRH
jgi:hypothetical protein